VRWLTADGAPDLSGATSPKRQDPHGLRSVVSLDALIHQFPAPSPAQAPGFREKLSTASECLLVARREIRRSIRTPMSLPETSILSDLLMRVSDFLGTDSVTSPLGRPVSAEALIDTGYRLLDTAHEYNILARHFYSDEAEAARARRSSDVAEAEIATVAFKAAALKLEVMKYLKRAEEMLRKSTQFN
jgi:hypothetical protein